MATFPENIITARAFPIPETVEEIVIDKIRIRQRSGLAKYGTTMQRTDLSRRDWLEHAQQEAMDLAIYLEKLIQQEL